MCLIFGCNNITFRDFGNSMQTLIQISPLPGIYDPFTQQKNHPFTFNILCTCWLQFVSVYSCTVKTLTTNSCSWLSKYEAEKWNNYRPSVMLKKALLLFEDQSEERTSSYFLKNTYFLLVPRNQPTNFLFPVINYLFILSCLEHYLSSEYRVK